MKTNEEFLQGIYGKRDVLVKKRKKRMAYTATAVCAALCVAAAVTANVFDGNGVNKTGMTTEIEQGGFMNRNENEAISGELNASHNDSDDKVQPEKGELITFVENYTFLTEDIARPVEISTGVNVDGNADKQFAYNEEIEGEAGIPEGVEAVTEQNDLAVEQTTQAVVKVDDLTESTAAPPKAPKPTTQEIIDKAYSVIPEGEREFVIKESANSTVRKYNDGRVEYEVYFRTTQDKCVGVKLDLELNPLFWQGAE